MTIREQPLTFASFQALSKECNLGAKMISQIKKQSPQSLKLLITLTDNAKLRLKEGNAEQAFILYRRAMELSQLVNNKKTQEMSAFRSSPDGQRYLDLSNKLIDAIHDLYDQLKLRYKLREEDQLEEQLAAVEPAPTANGGALSVLQPSLMQNQSDDFDGIYIKAQQLVRFVENKKGSALIFDYREEKPKLIEYLRIQNVISVAHLDPSALIPGCILSMLGSQMDISDRPLLQNISGFDLVVLMGDTNEVKKPYDELSKSSKTRILYEALTTYNPRSRLRRAPLIMVYGFQGWDMAYSCYTKEGIGYRKELSMETAFGALLADALKATGLDISYPELIKPAAALYALPQPSSSTELYPHPSENVHPTSINASVYENVVAPRNVPFPTAPAAMDNATTGRPTPVPRTVYPSASHITDPLNRPTMSITERRASPPYPAAPPTKPTQQQQYPTIPSVDRTTKPSAPPQQRPTSFPVEADAPPTEEQYPSVAMDKENVSPTPILASCAATAAMYSLDSMKKGLPVVQTLGGARVAANAEVVSPISQPASHYPPQAAPIQRPPTPDRSTKAPLLNNVNHTEKQTPQLFYQVYNAALKNIDDESKHGGTLPGYTGLYNLKNTCFMNTTLQALFNTPKFVDLFTNKRVGRHINMNNVKFGTMGVISGCFAALMDSVWSGKYVAIRPIFFLDTFAHRVNPDLADRRQHDAQEFQMFLLDALHEDTSKINQGRPFEQNYTGQNLVKEADDYLRRQRLLSNSIINDIFHSRTVSRISCTVCMSASVTFEEMSQISVELPSHAVQKFANLQECLQRHFADVLLDGQSCWNCPRCKSPQVAGRSTKLWMLPPILVIHMKRFSLDGGEYVKNEIEVGFEISKLDMSSYVHEKAPMQNPYYSLYAVTNHDGRLNSGHYTSCVKNLRSGEWLKFDDETCTRISPSSITTKKAFILYYANTSSAGSSGGGSGGSSL